jgi:hypothetical protein
MGKGPDGEELWSGFGAENKTGSAMLATLLTEYNRARSADDRRRLREKEVGGKLPTEYLFQGEGGTLIEDLGTDPNVIVNAGGGLQPSGWRLNPLSINALKNK